MEKMFEIGIWIAISYLTEEQVKEILKELNVTIQQYNKWIELNSIPKKYRKKLTEKLKSIISLQLNVKPEDIGIHY